MEKIQRVSRLILKALNVLLIASPICFVTFWAFIDHPYLKGLLQQGLLSNPIDTPEGAVNLGEVDWTVLGKCMGILGDGLALIITLLGLFTLNGLFKNYQKGYIFSLDNTQKYKFLGWLFFLKGLVVIPFSQMFMVLAVSLSNPPGHRYITLSFGTPNLEALFCGTLIIVISWVMSEGYKLQEDHQLTI
jgi:hypothetical protein